jgi:hypothetical protein
MAQGQEARDKGHSTPEAANPKSIHRRPALSLRHSVLAERLVTARSGVEKFARVLSPLRSFSIRNLEIPDRKYPQSSLIKLHRSRMSDLAVNRCK